MLDQYNQKIEIETPSEYEKYQNTLMALFIKFLGKYYTCQNKYKKDYLGKIYLFMANQVFKYLIEMGQKRLINYLLERENQHQSTQSKKQVIIVADKTSDGPRHGRRQYYAHKQYTGSYGVVKTHGWFFLLAVLGTSDNPEIIILGASLYIKGTSESEWREGYKLLEMLGIVLDKAGIDRQSVTFVGDNTYFCEQSIQLLEKNGWIYVGKAGGQKIVTINGITAPLSEHARRNLGKYQKISARFHDKTKVTQYVRAESEVNDRIYFHGLFERPYSHWAYPKRLLVTNKKGATPQWVFQRYNQRWKVECLFRILKQTCGWREYQPQGSGNSYQVHTGFVLLFYSYLDYTRRSIRGLGKYTIGQVRKWLLTKHFGVDGKTIFPNQIPDFTPLKEIIL